MSRLLLCTVLTACVHTEPKEMTAAEHRAEARVHQQEARKETEEFKSGMVSRAPDPRSPFMESRSPAGSEYNPTAGHLDAADRELKRAADHLVAARALEAFETAACREIPPAERAACPLLASWVTVVRDTPRGIEMELKGSVDPPAIEKRLSCHLAYAEAKGFDRPSCPLFVRAMTLGLRGRTLLFEAATPEVARQLQLQARRIFAPETISDAVSANP